MPRGGAVTLADVREPSLVIVCERCGRRGCGRPKYVRQAHGSGAGQEGQGLASGRIPLSELRLLPQR
jgi:hypothetical protein